MKPVTLRLFLFLILAGVAGWGAALAAGPGDDEGPYWPAAKRAPATETRPARDETRRPMWTISSEDEEVAVKAPVRPKTKAPKAVKAVKAAKAVKVAKAVRVAKARPVVRAAVVKTTPAKATPVKTAAIKTAPVKTAAPAPAVPPRPLPVAKPATPTSGQSASATDMADQIIFADVTRACTARDANACLMLGRMYASGTIAAKNTVFALQSYRRACDLGNNAACHTLGEMHEKGAGVKVSLSEAERFYRLACKGGNTAACKSGERLSIRTKAAKFRLPDFMADFVTGGKPAS